MNRFQTMSDQQMNTHTHLNSHQFSNSKQLGYGLLAARVFEGNARGCCPPSGPCEASNPSIGPNACGKSCQVANSNNNARAPFLQGRYGAPGMPGRMNEGSEQRDSSQRERVNTDTAPNVRFARNQPNAEAPEGNNNMKKPT